MLSTFQKRHLAEQVVYGYVEDIEFLSVVELVNDTRNLGATNEELLEIHKLASDALVIVEV